MTKIFINGQQVVLKDGTEIKITRENPYFYNSGAYTLDVTLPLDAWQNIAVFGHINRMYVAKENRKFKSEIYSDDYLVFKGTATIISVTQDDVKVQFLSGNSSVKYWDNVEGKYIDETDYHHTSYVIPYETSSAAYIGKVPAVKLGDFIGIEGEYCFCCINDENGNVNNGYYSKEIGETLINRHIPLIFSETENKEEVAFVRVLPRLQAAQPNLMFILRYVLESQGYKIRRNCVDSDMIKSIYIANAAPTVEKKDSGTDYAVLRYALPHWTVSEFLDEVGKFLHVVFVFDDVTKSVDILDKPYYLDATDITEDVVDEYEYELINEDDADTVQSDSNVQYEMGDSSYHNIDCVAQDVIAHFDTFAFSSYQEMDQAVKNFEPEWAKSVVFKCPDGVYCYADEEIGLQRINHFGMLVRNEKYDSSVSLKICPVAMTEMYGICGWQAFLTDVALKPQRLKESNIGILSLCSKTIVTDSQTVWDALNGETEETSKEDVMQVFILDKKKYGFRVEGGKFEGTLLPFPAPWTDPTYRQTNENAQLHESWSMSLNKLKNVKTIGDVQDRGFHLNKYGEISVVVIADRIPSVFRPYFIRGKKYLAKKIEVKCNEEGLKKEMKMYLTPMD